MTEALLWLAQAVGMLGFFALCGLCVAVALGCVWQILSEPGWAFSCLLAVGFLALLGYAGVSALVALGLVEAPFNP